LRSPNGRIHAGYPLRASGLAAARVLASVPAQSWGGGQKSLPAKNPLSKLPASISEKRTGQFNGSGDYSFTLLPVGHYSITVKAGGFQVSITKDLAIEAGDRARAGVHLQTGSETTTIEVTAITALLQADRVRKSESPTT
jgi:hypothetical protein